MLSNLNAYYKIQSLWLKGPKDERAQRNLDYYSRTLKEIKLKLAGDDSKTVSVNAVQEKLTDPFEFKNPRPAHVLGKERDVYEALCRGDFPEV